MKICILSDSHDHIPLLGAAVHAAKEEGAEAVLHCGDVVAPSTLKITQQFGLPVHVIYGNNTGDLYMMSRIANKPGSVVTFYGQDAGITLGGKKIFLVHYPHYAKAMATTGDWDLVCCGHEHATSVQVIDNINGGVTHLVNPGTVGGVAAPATWMLCDLETMEFHIREVTDSSEYENFS